MRKRQFRESDRPLRTSRFSDPIGHADGSIATTNARQLALLYAYWILAESLFDQGLVDKDQFFGRATSAYGLLRLSGNLKAAVELEGIIDPLAENHIDAVE